ncbi:MAG TPA: VOC family protein [Chroococcidiopsis sp.]
MAFEFDHLFICVDVNGMEGDRLVALGLTEGSANTHPGQGTANRRFFFHNAMIELLWVHNPAEAQSAPIRRTHLWERWQQRQAPTVSPFGICLRPSPNAVQDAVPAVAFDHWDYHPPYLPAHISIAIGTNSDLLSEPMLFHIPFGQRPDQAPPAKAQPLIHPLGLREISRVEIIHPAAQLSPEFQAALATHTIRHRVGPAHYLELGFDGEISGQQVDLRPHLPLVMSW